MPKITEVLTNCAGRQNAGKSLDEVIDNHSTQFHALKEEYPDMYVLVGDLLWNIMYQAEESWPKEEVT